MRFCLNEELRRLWLGKRRVMSGAGSGRGCEGGDNPALRGQIWHLPYLVANRLKMTAYFVKNAINEKCKVGWALWLGKGRRLGKGRAGQRGDGWVKGGLGKGGEVESGRGLL